MAYIGHDDVTSSGDSQSIFAVDRGIKYDPVCASPTTFLADCYVSDSRQNSFILELPSKSIPLIRVLVVLFYS